MSAKPAVPDNYVPPPGSPEPNPVKDVRRVIRDSGLPNRVFPSCQNGVALAAPHGTPASTGRGGS